ncbi:extracellular solute-binding protein [uncultured Pseudokineococcus sp.]|uniref:extracellular solute-binding protein n=1 Tax=uncultured Pseudokineococcus sp. TaxID=1642928 RepID=UPI002612E6EA|nr:extracellular solute-binding protein [uncultured Pseudokineococcus sp.]
MGPRPRDPSGSARTGRRRRRRLPGSAGAAAPAAVVVAAALLASCGSEGEEVTADGTPVLNWYINPDSGGQQEIARRCTEENQGRFALNVQILPNNPQGQREQLVRRLVAGDSSVDIMSLDPPFIPEFSEAGFFAPMPPEVADAVSEGVLDGALAGATYADELVTVPFWANTQLLWYRQSVAEEAGLDMSGPVTWDEIIDAAEQTGTTVGVQGRAAESMTVWVNALVVSQGGDVLANPEAPAAEIEVDLDSPEGREAAAIMQRIADAGVGGPQLSTADEDASAALFESDAGGFMVNWPYVWARGQTLVEQGSLEQSVLDDYGWTLYPRVDADVEPATPYGGINLGVGAFTDDPDLAYEAAQCIASVENQTYYFLSNGNPPSNAAAFDDESLLEDYPMAPTIQESTQLAAPRPQTPFYDVVSTGIQRTWRPETADPETTPERSAELITEVLRGEALL